MVFEVEVTPGDEQVIIDFANNGRVLAPWEPGKTPSDEVVAVSEGGDEARSRVRVQSGGNGGEDDEQESGLGENGDLSFVEELENAEVTTGDRGEKGHGLKGVFDCGVEGSADDFDGKRDTKAFDYAVKTVSNEEVKEPAAKSVLGASDYAVKQFLMEKSRNRLPRVYSEHLIMG